MTLAIRLALVLVALVTCAWLAVGYDDARLEARGQAALDRARQGFIPAREVRSAAAALKDSRRLNSDQAPLITEGLLMSFVSRRARAEALARRAVDAEPDNVQAWFLRFVAAPDAKVAAEARRRVVQLNPWAGDR